MISEVNAGMNNQEQLMAIVSDLLVAAKKYWWIIMISFILLTTAAFVMVQYVQEDTYTASGVLYVSNKNADGEEEASIKKSDIDTSKTISTTYIELLKTRDFLMGVSEATGGKHSWGEIKSKMQVVSVGDTELLEVSVTTTNPEDSYLMAYCIIQKAPEKLKSIYAGGTVEIADSVYKPTGPNGKSLVTKVGASAVLGILLGFGIIFLINFFDRKVHGAAAVTDRYKLSVLGEVPQNASFARKRKKIKDADSAENILNESTAFNIVETYKAIRTNIMFSTPKSEEGQVIAVVSSCPGEGKTTVSINLAISFAQTGAKVMLIDCDLRKSRVHRYLDIDRKDGVSNVVCGYTPLEKAVRKGIRENLDCLTAGEIPPNPAELLGTEEFHAILSELKKQYDYIFIDTPPMMAVTDAAVVMKYCNDAVIVARENLTTYDVLDVTLENVSASGVKILGAVLLISGDSQKKYGYYKYGRYGKYGYKYRYSYRYGDTPKEEEVKKAKDTKEA